MAPETTCRRQNRDARARNGHRHIKGRHIDAAALVVRAASKIALYTDTTRKSACRPGRARRAFGAVQ